MYDPGCDEHYLVHVMREHPDFLPEYGFVAVVDDRVVGNIMYARSKLIDENGFTLTTLTFGPVSVLPQYQRKGIGSALIRHTIKKAVSDNYKAIVIEGHPHNYCVHGFKCSKDFSVSDSEGKYPYSLLVLELEKGSLQGRQWRYYPSEVYQIDTKAAKVFDNTFPKKKKEYKYTQELFSISSRAFVGE
ncbi:GNAT family N-acetyltransferase [Cellulosispirillum alkaliphilum]|uniref:GNAT family N-acetyltransferase n=1 Tax=Cellulosispirillum alkaliphilum TaxID=3039283 RepID=UPI003D6F10F3